MKVLNRKERKAFLSEMGYTAFWNRTPRGGIPNVSESECRKDSESGREETKQVHLKIDKNAFEVK